MLTHISKNGKPQMVDVSAKKPTTRQAKAQTTVVLPDEVLKAITDGEIQTKKGPVFQAAIIAGTMAAKKTSELIPFCHTLSIDDCKIFMELKSKSEVVITCTVKAKDKTGVEMEALVGASIAALTIYDMCKALSQNIIIRNTLLLEKRGGKTDFVRD